MGASRPGTSGQSADCDLMLRKRHLLGASGARLALTLAYELRKREKRYGLASLCIGGGQGIAAILERV